MNLNFPTPKKGKPHGGNRGVDIKDHKFNRAYMRPVSRLYDAAPALAPRLRRPPFGREVETELEAGRHPNCRLYACRDAWKMARKRRASYGPGSILVLPPGDDPECYRWPPLEDLVGRVDGLPGNCLVALARALVRDGVHLAYLLDAENFGRSLRIKGVQS